MDEKDDRDDPIDEWVERLRARRRRRKSRGPSYAPLWWGLAAGFVITAGYALALAVCYVRGIGPFN